MSSIGAVRAVMIAMALGFCLSAEALTAEQAQSPSPSAISPSATPSSLTHKSAIVTQKAEANDLRAEAKAALRASAAAKTAGDRGAAAHELVRVFIELRADQNLSTSERHSLYHQVRSRLLAVEQGLRSAINRQRRKQRLSPRDAAGGGDVSGSKQTAPSSVDAAGGQAVLAQQLGPGIPPNNQPPQAAPPGAAGATGRQDHGQELLDLIQKVIKPSTWDINGGPSSGYYYQPLHALVISAPSDVHVEIGGVLRGLRQ